MLVKFLSSITNICKYVYHQKERETQPRTQWDTSILGYYGFPSIRFVILPSIRQTATSTSKLIYTCKGINSRESVIERLNLQKEICNGTKTEIKGLQKLTVCYADRMILIFCDFLERENPNPKRSQNKGM